MENKEKYVSLTEMSKLRGITTETLRHYDRIGLLKADYQDKNKTRYYSILKYEKLGTIRELQQLGMSLKEIKEYFSRRTLQSSLELLKQQKELVEARLAELEVIHKKTVEKLSFLSSISNNSCQNEVVIKEFEERHYIIFENPVHDDIELAHGIMNLEKIIYEEEKYFPIYATNRYGGLINSNLTKDSLKCSQLICFIPAGKYCCVRNKGDFWDWKKPIAQIQQFLHDNNISARSDKIIENVIVDYTISDLSSERLFEFQLFCETPTD